MNRFFPFISCAFVGILVSSCARTEPVYGSRSASPHRPAKHHHVALAQVPLRHRAASEGQRRPLRPWNHLPAASEGTRDEDRPGLICGRISCLVLAAELERLVGGKSAAFNNVRDLLEGRADGSRLVVHARRLSYANQGFCQFPAQPEPRPTPGSK